MSGSRYEEMIMETRFNCCNCGSIINDPAINAPCPRCGWTGSRYIEPEKRLINKKEATKHV